MGNEHWRISATFRINLPMAVESGTTANPGLLTTRQMAQKHGFSVATVHSWRSRGGGPPYRKIGNRVYYVDAEVRGWIDSHKRVSTAPRVIAGGRS